MPTPGAENVVLVGFMGTGKSSVGRILARRLRLRLIDVDDLIERTEGRRISEIFAADGEPHFRRLEKEAIRRASAEKGAVITTGGGAVVDPENLGALRATGRIISLQATPETVYQRVRSSKHRPLLANKPDLLEEVRRLMAARAPYYQQADAQVRTDGRTPLQVAREIEGLLRGGRR
ncbi:MAG: Shikimate kinase [Candidatus Omnitrophica bacterium]|nr:Shikimate kinase [Candidatus Omnitrophota bacterium]